MTYRIGILGAAGIAPEALITPARRRSDVTVAAVASRRLETARSYASAHDLPKFYQGYDELLADPEIDIIYNALPPAGHAEWSIKALRAGKHVLCEKPFAMSAVEARAMVAAEAESGKLLMEAFHDRYHPVFLHLLDLKPTLGTIRAIHAEFLVDIPYDPANIRYDPAQGGGALMDLGVYPLHWLRSFMQSEPVITSAVARLSELGSDTRFEATLNFGEVQATLLADIQHPQFKGLLRIEATGGVVEIDNPCLPHKGHSVRTWLGNRFDEYTIAGGATYDYQLSALLDAIRTGQRPLTGGEDAVANMDAVDALYAAAVVERPTPKENT